MKKLLLITFIGLFGCSCSENDSDNVIIDIDHCVPPSEFFEPVFDMIPLETDSNSIISAIHKVKIYNECYYVEDDNSNTIFIFNKDGSFSNKISNWGRGHGEYSDIMDYDIFEDNIYILARGMSKILRYDINCKYIDCIEVDDDYTEILALRNNNILLFANNSGATKVNFKIFNWDTKAITNEWDKFDEFCGLILGKNALNRCDSCILITKPYDHNIYIYDGQEYKSLLNVAFNGCDNIPKIDNYFERHKAIHNNQLKVVEFFSQVMIHTNSIYTCFYCMVNNSITDYLSKIDLQTNMAQTINIGYLTDYIEFPFLHFPVAMQDGMLITQTFPSSIINYHSDYLNKYPQLSNLKNDDNPILVVHYMK